MDTMYLLALRTGIIFWTQLMVWPWETVFDRIEDELEKRGVVLGVGE